MIRLFIDKIDEEEGIICVSLTSSDGAKIVSEDYKGDYKVNGITREFPIKLVLHEGKDYFLTDSGNIKFLRERVDEFKTSLRKSNNTSR